MPRGLDYIINLREGATGGATAVRSELQGLDNQVDQTNSKLSSLGVSAKGLLVGMATGFAAISVKGLADDLIEVRGQFQGFENLLKNALGDAEGANIFQQIKDDAAVTPFEVEQLTESFIKLQSSGFNPTIDKINQLGDVAAAKMKGIDQLTEAVIDAQQGEFERLKEFGIRASKSGDQVTFTYNNVSKTMKFSAGAVEDYILALSKQQGIQGSMAAMADTYIGKQSNINDQLTQFKNGLAQDLQPALDWYLNAQSESIVLMQSGVDWVKQNTDVVKTLGIVVGVAAGAYLLYQGYLLALEIPMAIITAKQWLLNAALTANPIGLIVTGIAALIAGFVVAYRHSENFRAAIQGLIEVGKLVGRAFMAVGKTIIGALTFDKKMFMSGLVETGQLVTEVLSGGVKKAFMKGFDESKAKSKADAAKEAKEGSTMDTIAKPKPKGGGGGIKVGGAGTTGSSSGGTTLSTNKQVRNVTVTIGKLVENLTVSTTNLQSTGPSDLKRLISEVLTGAVHDSELALSND